MSESDKAELFTLKEVAKILRLSHSGARRLVQSGKLSGVNISGGKKRAVWRVHAAALREFVNPDVKVNAAPEEPRRKANSPLPPGVLPLV